MVCLENKGIPHQVNVTHDVQGLCGAGEQGDLRRQLKCELNFKGEEVESQM